MTPDELRQQRVPGHQGDNVSATVEHVVPSELGEHTDRQNRIAGRARETHGNWTLRSSRRIATTKNP